MTRLDKDREPTAGATAGRLDRTSGVSLWRQILEALKREIEAGVHQPGARLPTEQELSQRFRVNRHTVRQALASLAEDGLVQVQQGRGTFVSEAVVDYRVGRRTRFSENLARAQREPGGRLIVIEEVRADATVAEALGLRKGTRVIHAERIGEADGQPISVASHFFPKSRFQGIGDVLAHEASITRALAHFGVRDYSRTFTRVTARMPSRRDAELLHQPRNRPVLVTESVNVDPDGHPIEFGLTRFASDRVQVVVES